VKRSITSFDRHMQRYGSSLLDVARTKEPWLAGLPLAFMVLTLILATALPGDAVRKQPQLFIGIICFDLLVKWFGNLLCLPVLVYRVYVFWPKPDFLTMKHGSRISWVPSSWVFGPLVIWLVMGALRWIGFLLMHPYSDGFSDHVFLLMSMVAMIQMELILAHVAVASRGGQSCGGLKVIAIAWILLLLICWEAFNSARYFQFSTAATWIAFLAGLVFLPIVIKWSQLVVHSGEELRSQRRDDDGNQCLLEGM